MKARERGEVLELLQLDGSMLPRCDVLCAVEVASCGMEACSCLHFKFRKQGPSVLISPPPKDLPSIGFLDREILILVAQAETLNGLWAVP